MSEAQAKLEIVQAFYRDLYQTRDLPAVERLLADDLVQHNPAVPAGAAAAVAHFSAYFAGHPQATMDIQRIAVSGDLVFVHAHGKDMVNDPGRAVVDILRIQDHRIVEQWQVVQPVPTHSVNGNPMI